MFHETLQSLAVAYDENVQKVRRKRVFGSAGGTLRIPVLSGPTGTGKSDCVMAFAEERGFDLVRLDCSFEPADFLVARLFNAIHGINSGQSKGVVLLVNNMNQAGQDWLEILDQYARNELDTSMQVAAGSTDSLSQPIEYVTKTVKFEEIPEQLFVVGEQWTG